MKNSETFETGCCAKFKTELWDNKKIIFNDKLFLKDHVYSLFHVPLNFGKVMERDMKKIEAARALPSEQLVLSDETSLWGSDVYIAVDKKVPKAHMEKISGTFLTKVFEGPYKNMGKNIEEMNNFLLSKGKEATKFYFYYPYCPNCAKAYGENFTVILAQV